MYKVLQSLVVTILIGTLLMGRCLPCGDLYAKAQTKSCCDKSGACNKVPNPKSKNSPCPFQQNVVASDKADRQTLKVQLVAEIQLALIPALIMAPPQTDSARALTPFPQYSPPLLYVLHERFLI